MSSRAHSIFVSLFLSLYSKIKVMHYKSITASNRRIIVMSIHIYFHTFDGILYNRKKQHTIALIAIYIMIRYEFGPQKIKTNHHGTWPFDFFPIHTCLTSDERYYFFFRLSHHTFFATISILSVLGFGSHQSTWIIPYKITYLKKPTQMNRKKIRILHIFWCAILQSLSSSSSLAILS